MRDDLLSASELVGGEKTYCNTVVKRISPLAREGVLGGHLSAKGYCVDTVGLNAEMVQQYVRVQKKEERGQLQLQGDPRPSGPSRRASGYAPFGKGIRQARDQRMRSLTGEITNKMVY